MINTYKKIQKGNYISDNPEDAKYALSIKPNKVGVYELCEYTVNSYGGIVSMYHRHTGKYRKYSKDKYIFVTRNVQSITESIVGGCRVMASDFFNTCILPEITGKKILLKKEEFK